MNVRKMPAWTVAALFAVTFAVSHAARPVAAPRTVAMQAIPMTLSAWVGQSAPPLDPETARVLGADQYVHRYYAAGDATPVEMDVAYYSQPRVGATAHSPLNCLPGNGWRMSEPSVREVHTATGTRLVREVTVARGESRWAMIYWYQTPHRIDHDEFASRWHLFTDALQRRPADTAMVRVMAPLSDHDAAGRDAVAAFTSELIPQVERALATGR